MTSALPAQVPRSAQITELDVRDDLRNGREPFSRIMAAVDSLPAESVLHLRATFEPVPLFRVLGKKGYAHAARQNEPGDWSVWFWKDPADHSDSEESHVPHSSAAATAGEVAAQSTTTIITLDVRGLEPPEPMIRTLSSLETLPAGHELLQINVRVPQFLLPILAERGYSYEIDESRAEEVRVRIRRAK